MEITAEQIRSQIGNINVEINENFVIKTYFISTVTIINKYRFCLGKDVAVETFHNLKRHGLDDTDNDDI